jgi:hypothetical protein
VTLAGLFTVDSFGIGLMGQSLASYWFFTRFGIPPQELGLMFFGASVLTATSLWVAAKRAGRIGLVNTIGLDAHPLQPPRDRHPLRA